MTLLSDLKSKEKEFFNIKPIFNTNYKKITMDCMYSLIFILYYLEERGYTLSHICLSDFVIYDKYLFLKHDTHVVKLENGYYLYEAMPTTSLDFLPPMNKSNPKTHVYKSVGQFAFWILTHKNIEITESSLEPYYYTKPYFFIKNAMDIDPCLIYL